MIDQPRRFESLVLRPLQILFLVSAGFFLVKGMWWWLAGCAVGVLYLGIVGSKLHPLQSASDLAQGPTEGSAARIESELLSPDMKRMLVGHACTRVGIMIGIAVGMILWGALAWHWYFALLVVWPIILLSGALLKLAVKAV